jgi:hypothetical protein
MPDVYALLDSLGIRYERYDHAPVFTCEEADAAVPSHAAVQRRIFSFAISVGVDICSS